MQDKTKIALKLSLLSAFVGEVVSSSIPPLEIINPFTFLFLWGFYGSGVLLVREFWVRWERNLFSLMLLGISYGITEEGLVVKSFFDPNWPDLGKLAVYGRFAVNLVWAVWLSIFHAVFSISIPILLIQIFHPEYEKQSLLSSRALKIVFGIFLFISLIIFSFLNPYSPPPFQYLLTFLSIILLLLAAKKCKRLSFSKSISSPSSRNFLYGAFFTFSMFFFFFIIPETPVPAIIPSIAAIFLVIQLYKRFDGLRFNPRETLILTLGLLAPFLLFFDFIAELNGGTGMSLVGISTFIILLLLLRTLTKKEVRCKNECEH